MDLVSFFLHEEAGKKFLDNVGPGSHGSETAGFAQCAGQGAVLMLHIAHRVFHGCDQGAFGKISRRTGPALSGADGVYCKICALFKCNSCASGKQAVRRIIFKASIILVCFRILPVGVVDFPPSGLQDDVPLCAEYFAVDGPGQGSLFVFACGREDREKTADDQIVDLSLFRS